MKAMMPTRSRLFSLSEILCTSEKYSDKELSMHVFDDHSYLFPYNVILLFLSTFPPSLLSHDLDPTSAFWKAHRAKVS